MAQIELHHPQHISESLTLRIKVDQFLLGIFTGGSNSKAINECGKILEGIFNLVPSEKNPELNDYT